MTQSPSDLAALSLARGATEVPLIEQTIGEFFDAMVARQPGREALVSVHHGRRYTYRELQDRGPYIANGDMCNNALLWQRIVYVDNIQK